MAAQKQTMEDLKIEFLKHFGLIDRDGKGVSDWEVRDSTSAIIPDKTIVYDEILNDEEEFSIRKIPRYGTNAHHQATETNYPPAAHSTPTAAIPSPSSAASRRKRSATQEPQVPAESTETLPTNSRKRGGRKRGSK